MQAAVRMSQTVFDTLADIRNISRINSVVLRRQSFDRAALDEILEGARVAALQ